MTKDTNALNQQSVIRALKGNNANTVFSGIPKKESVPDEMLSKMVRGQETDAAIRDESPTTSAQADIFIRGALAASIERIRDASNTLQLLPDIKQVLEIMIGSILSPKDMGEPTLTYTSTFEELGDVSTTMLKYVKKYFTSSYKLEDRLDEILWDIFGYTGSYPIAVLPETSLDYMINSNSTVTMESLTTGQFDTTGNLKNIGWLGSGSSDQVSNEDVDVLSFFRNVTGNTDVVFESRLIADVPEITVCDNFDILKMPGLRRKITDQASHQLIASQRETVNSRYAKAERATIVSSMEAIRSSGDDYTRKQTEIADLNSLYPNRQFRATPMMRVKTADTLERKSIGHPKTLKIPTEAVIPVVNPMNTRDHVGYFVLIDQAGFAVRISDVDSLYKMIQTNSSSLMGSNMGSVLLQRAATANSANTGINANDVNKMQALAEAVPIFQQQIERTLLDRISSGKLGQGYKLADMEGPTLLMLSRALMQKQTQLLFIPASLMAYMATDYDQFGLGKTLLDDSKLLASLRSLNQMVNSIASTKNAITRRSVNIRIPAAEKDPAKAVRMMMQEMVKGTQAEYPLSNSPADQINYIQASGISVKVEDHPSYPNSEFTVDATDNQYKPISTEYDEYLKNQHIRSFGFSPELINGSMGTDFATQTIFANVLTARVIRKLSNRVTPNLSDFVRKFTFNSTTLFDGLVDILKNTNVRFKRDNGTLLSDEEVVTTFIESIEVSLPPADKTQMLEQKEALEAARDFYGEAVDQFFASEWMGEDVLGRVGGAESVDSLKAYIKSYYVREWMKKNGVGLELFDLIEVGKDGKPLIDFEESYADLLDALGRSLLPFHKRKLMRSGNIDAHLDKFEESLPNKPAEDSFGGGDGGDSGFDDGQDDGFDDGLSDPEFDEGASDTDPESEDEPTDDDLTEGDPNDNDDDTTDENGKDAIV